MSADRWAYAALRADLGRLIAQRNAVGHVRRETGEWFDARIEERETMLMEIEARNNVA